MAQTGAKKQNRVILLDEIRGFAILCMVVYHAMFQLKYSFDVDVPVFFEGWFDIIRDIFAGIFIFISGCMCRFSRNNLKRGVQCFFLGMIITFTMPFFGQCIEFGILHMLGISMMLYGLFGEGFERIPPLVGILICAALAFVSWNIKDGFIMVPGIFEWDIPEKLYKMEELYPLGFPGRNYGDYFPLLPWFFVFLGGSGFGAWAKEGSLPKAFYASHFPWLAKVGRYTIWIYMIHLPVIYLIFSLIFR